VWHWLNVHRRRQSSRNDNIVTCRPGNFYKCTIFFTESIFIKIITNTVVTANLNDFVDNDSCCRMKNKSINMRLYHKDGVHLNLSGSYKLAENIGITCKTKTPSQSNKIIPTHVPVSNIIIFHIVCIVLFVKLSTVFPIPQRWRTSQPIGIVQTSRKHRNHI
jgi:hypothetical protein